MGLKVRSILNTEWIVSFFFLKPMSKRKAQ